MGNDMRSMAEKLRDIDIDNLLRDADHERGMDDSSSRARETTERKPYVTDRDTGDEEGPKRGG